MGQQVWTIYRFGNDIGNQDGYHSNSLILENAHALPARLLRRSHDIVGLQMIQKILEGLCDGQRSPTEPLSPLRAS